MASFDKDLYDVLVKQGPASSAQAAGAGFAQGQQMDLEQRKAALQKRVIEAGLMPGDVLNTLIPGTNAPADREFTQDVVSPLAHLAASQTPAKRSPTEIQLAQLELAKKRQEALEAGERRRQAQFEFEKSQKTKPNIKEADRAALQTLNEVSLNLKDIADTYSPSFVGYGDQLLTGVKQFTGIGASEKATTFRQAVGALRNTIIKARSGSAVTPSEAARLLIELPDAKFSDKDFITRFNNTVRKFNVLIETRRKTYQNVQDVPELFNAPSLPTASEQAGNPSQSGLPDVTKMTDEELQRIVNGR